MPAGKWAREWTGLAPLGCVLLFNLIFLAPELHIGRFPPNDGGLHLAAAERLEESLAHGEPFLDPWVSEWSLGFPFWRSYQPLPHVLAAGVLALAGTARDHAAVFAALQYLLIALLPVSVYASARMLGLTPLGAGLSSLLCLSPSSWGEYGRYGLNYGAMTWRGSGLFTQIVALHLLSLSIGAISRSLDTGRRRLTASALLAASALSHIVFGYVAFLSSALLAVVGPKGERSRRLVRLATILLPALLLLAWFVVPLVLSRGEINHSRWEAQYKWDSFGAPDILREISHGRFFDAGRFPVLSIFVLAGAACALFRLGDALPRRLLSLTLLWLALFFGRSTWGHLLLLAGVPHDLHLHRLQAAFELSSVFLASWGIADIVSRLSELKRWARPATILVAAALLAGLGVIGVERAHYLEENKTWGEASLQAIEREQADVDSALGLVRSILDERPGRVSAGKAATWGRELKVGAVPFYAFLTRHHLDQVSFLYHSMSLPSDIMVLRDESDGTHDTAMGVRAVVAPADKPMPAYLRLRGKAGRFAVYESSAEGYFGLVDIAGRYDGPPSTQYDPSSAWLASPALRQGIVYALDAAAPFVPAFGRWQPLPDAPAPLLTARGRVVSESKEREVYRAQLELERPCHAFVKITWHPDLVATVDGHPVPLVRVTPGFGAVAVPAGRHEVVVRYAPGPLKPVLFAGGVLSFIGLAFVSARRRRRASSYDIESPAIERLALLGNRLATPRVTMTLGLLALAILALRPLARGRLIEGHDATEYPPRLVEFVSILGDGHFPPVWAPDLSAGHGQPLFGFAPPLVYYTAVPFRLVGLPLADALQLGLFLLHLAGAMAMFRIGRTLGGTRGASFACTVLWLFVPYLALDLFVRTAFAESAAFAVAPIALWGVLCAMDRPSAKTLAFGAAGVSLVVLAHNAAALLLIPALALIVTARSLEPGSAGERVRRALHGFGAVAVGLGLSAFFWLPALVEKRFVKVELLREGFLHWKEHAIAPWQLLWSRWGFGISMPGTADGMSFAVGLAHLGLATAGLVIVLRRRRSRREGDFTYLALAIATIVGAWLATSWSSPVWEHVGTLQYFAYPWRALLLPGLLLPILAVPLFVRLTGWFRIALVAVVVVLNLPHTEPKGYFTFDDAYYEPQSIATKGLNTSTREEYEPRWVETRPPYAPKQLSGRSSAIVAHEVAIDATRQEWSISAAAPTDVEANTLYYPGWQVTVDDAEVPVVPVAVSGTMSFPVPAGDHRVVLRFRPTPVRRGALLASAVTLLALASWFGIGSLRKQRREAS